MPDAPPTPDPTPAPAADPADPKPDDGKTFTQADVDRIIQGRLAKYGDYDAVKAELEKAREANKTESEKAITAAKDEGRAEARQEGAEALALEVFNGLAGRRNADYDTAPALSLISLAKFVKDDHTVDRDGIKAAVEQLVPAATKAAPHFGGGARKTSEKPDVMPGVARIQAAYEASQSK